MGAYYKPGEYVGSVIEQAWKTTRKGDPMLVLKVGISGLIVLEDGEERLVDVTNRYERTIYTPFIESNEKVMEMALSKLRHACNWQGTDFGQLNLVGDEIRLVCEEGEYQGQPSEQWGLALPRRSKPIGESDESLPRKLNALFGRKLKEGIDDAPASAPPPTDGDSVNYDDDIPF